MKVWQEFLRSLDQELGEQTVDTWLRSLPVHVLQPDLLQIHARDSFQVLWFEEHVRPLAESRLVDESGKKWRVQIIASEQALPAQMAPKTRSKKPSLALAPKLELRTDALDPTAQFEKIIEHEGCNFALRAMKELAQDPARFVSDGFNPVYIYGLSGSGKSLLLMAMTQALQRDGKKVLYVTGETFTHHVVQAIRLGMMQDFRRFYRGIDALVLDGVEILSNKSATQEEFFHTFNALHVQEKPIIVAANVPPKDLKGIEPRLISRFEWGLMLPIELPSSKDMERFLKMQCDGLRLSLSKPQARLLIDEFGSTPGLLARSLATLSLRIHRQKIHLYTLQPHELLPFLQDIKNEQDANALSPEKIVQHVSDQYGVTTKDILGKCQRREFSLPRQVAMYLCREKLQMPFLKIASLFGRDHSTVMASCKLIAKYASEKNSLAQELSIISQKL